MTKRFFKDERGATILFAMLAMLVALVVCAAILVAASSNAHHVKSQRESEQAYLTTNSAASMIFEGMKDDSVSYTITTVETYTNGTKTNTEVSDKVWQYNEAAGSAVNPLASEFVAWMKACDASSLAVEKTLSIAADGYDSVNVHVVISDFDINMAFSLADGNDGYLMSLKAPCGANDPIVTTTQSSTETTRQGVTTKTVTTVNTYTISWNPGSASIDKGDITAEGM